MLANLMSNNDPDAFIERMNAKAKELDDQHGLNNPSGAAIPPCKATIRSTIIQTMWPTRQLARDLGILVYHFLSITQIF